MDEIEGNINITRKKFPQWELYVLEKVNQEELAEECKKAAEYILNPNLGGYVWEEKKEDGIKWVLRSNEFPQWELYLDDKVDKDVNKDVLSNSLKKSSEWLRKGSSDFYKSRK